jgi:hypothetical protein
MTRVGAKLDVLAPLAATEAVVCHASEVGVAGLISEGERVEIVLQVPPDREGTLVFAVVVEALPPIQSVR